MTTEGDNHTNCELPTSLWYYTFYSCTKNGTTDASKQPYAYEDTPSTENNNNNREQQFQFWVEDEWTETDVLESEQLLESMQEYSASSGNKFRKLENEAAQNWNQFYKNHNTNFFNDRHYLPKAFPEEFSSISVSCSSSTSEQLLDTKITKKTVVEIGCGVGNAILPLLEQYPNWVIWGLDFSRVGIDLMRRDGRFCSASKEGRAFADVFDMTQREAPPKECYRVADLALMLFCLSAVPPPPAQQMEQAAQHAADVLKPGGILVFRDYGRYDQAQLKLGTGRNQSLGNNFYVKHDGTRCYYFELEDVRRLFVDVAGLEVVELRYIRRIYNNRANNEQRRRVWVQARFRKPALLLST